MVAAFGFLINGAFRVVFRIFRTFDQATAPAVSVRSVWSGAMFGSVQRDPKIYLRYSSRAPACDGTGGAIGLRSGNRGGLMEGPRHK